MDPFKKINKISLTSIAFGVIVLTLAWMMTQIMNPILQLQIGEAALVFLSMFFFSLTNDKIEEIQKITDGK